MTNKLRPYISSLVVMTVMGMWLFLSYQGKSVNPLLFTVVILYSLMAGYVVFGKRAFEEGQEALDALRDSDDEDNGGGR